MFMKARRVRFYLYGEIWHWALGIVYNSAIMHEACMRLGSWCPHSSLVDNPGSLQADLEKIVVSPRSRRPSAGGGLCAVVLWLGSVPISSSANVPFYNMCICKTARWLL